MTDQWFDTSPLVPKPIDSLPSNLFELKDDPYRSLAWDVLTKNGYGKTTVPHADFLWAEFFRARVSKKMIRSDFSKSVSLGTELASSPAAARLPGYSSNSGTLGHEQQSDLSTSR